MEPARQPADRDQGREAVRSRYDQAMITPSRGPDVRIEPMTDAHAGAVLAIYQAGIDEGNATFETLAPGWPAFDAARLPGHRFVATAAGRVTGWVAASATSGRCVYAGVVEHSVYVHPDARGRGTGRRLLDALITSTEAAGIWTIESGIFPENTASLALHRAAGFRAVGIRERIGQHHGRWRDVMLIERRSPVI
jgi:L-amino acid N-acyltransferase YncA